MINKRDAIFSLMLFVIASTTWYFMWIKPNTERMHSIMDCMHEIGDRSQAGYNVCAERLNEGR